MIGVIYIMKISFYNYKSLYLNNQKSYLRKIDKNLITGEFILGKELEKFEEKICKYLNVKYCLGTSSIHLQWKFSYSNA